MKDRSEAAKKAWETRRARGSGDMREAAKKAWETRRAREHGSNTIKVSVYFWTNHLPVSDLKTAWASGTAALKSNPSRGIKPKQVLFQSFDELPNKIKELLDSEGIKLVKGVQKVDYV